MKINKASFKAIVLTYNRLHNSQEHVYIQLIVAGRKNRKRFIPGLYNIANSSFKSDFSTWT